MTRLPLYRLSKDWGVVYFILKLLCIEVFKLKKKRYLRMRYNERWVYYYSNLTFRSTEKSKAKFAKVRESIDSIFEDDKINLWTVWWVWFGECGVVSVCGSCDVVSVMWLVWTVWWGQQWEQIRSVNLQSETVTRDTTQWEQIRTLQSETVTRDTRGELGKRSMIHSD